MFPNGIRSHFAAAVKQSVGGETASQNDVVEATIKRWFRSQEDIIRAERKAELLKQQMAKELREALENGTEKVQPVMELSAEQAQAVAAAVNPQ